MYDLNGKLKTGDEEKIAARLREYRDASRELFEDKLRTGVFENAYMEYLQELRDKGVAEEPDIPDSVWNQKIQEWKDANTRQVIKSEFYEKRNEILAQIKQILSKLSDAERKAIDQGVVWEKIIAITSGYRDADGQINGAELSEGQLKEIKTLQEELQRIRSGSVKTNGLTADENQLYYALLKKRQQIGLTAEEKKQYTELFNKKIKAVKLTRNEQKALDTLYEALGEMSTHNATEYYVDIMNNWLSKLDTTKHPGTPKSITQVTADELLDYDLINNLLIQDKEFKKWFQANHILREYKDKNGNNIREYVRTYAWNVVTPTDSTMYESYDIVDKEGNITTIQGLPARKYYSRQVKLEYRTERTVGVTIDNMGHPLPKSREEMAKSNLPEDKKYIFMNEAYEAMDKNSPLYRVLEKFKEFHLANQQGISRSAKLYLDAPRFRKSNLELIETGGIQKGTKEKVSLLTNLARRFRNFFTKTTDDVGDGVMNWNARMMLVRADMFDDELTDTPIAGLYDIEIEDTSTDVTNGVLRYMQSAEHHKKLLEISPIARAIEDTVNDPANAVKDINRVNKREMDNRNTLAYLTKKDYVRQKAVTALNERTLEGKSQAGFTKDYPWMTKVTNLLFKRASFSFFALNIPSALKNSLGMKFQAMIEAAAGNYTDMKSLHLGNVFAYKAMAELSFGQAYTKRGKSFTQQFVDVFDMAQRYEEKMGEEMSRTVLEDVASMTFWFSPRKFVELQATIQIGTSILYRQKVTQTLKDGTTKEIPYAEAFESRDGKIRLKKGIDIRYDVQPTQHYVKADDTIASIAKLYNVPEEIIEKIFDKRSLEDIRKKIEELQKEHLLKIQLIEDDINATNELISKETDKSKINNLQIRLIRLLDKRNKQNSYYEKKLMDEGSITIDNTQFKMMKNRVHQVINNLAGAYAKFDQPEAFRWFLYRMIIFLRRYFTSMAMNRFGFRGPIWSPKGRPNPGLGDVQMGYYVQFLKTLAETVRSLGQNIPTMTKEEVKATIRFFTEIGALIITTQLCSWLFGWDPDDEDRFKKLKAKSGPMGMLGLTSDDDSRKFNLGGYLELHTLHLLMQVRAENEQFNPITGGLKQYNSLLDLKSVALGPTTDSFTQVISDLNMWIHGDDRGRYARKVGPYKWQDKNTPKFLNHFAKMFGVTGTSLDPALAIQNFQSYQSKIKR